MNNLCRNVTRTHQGPLRRGPETCAARPGPGLPSSGNSQSPVRGADAPVSGWMCEYRGYLCKTVSGEGGRSHVTLPFQLPHCWIYPGRPHIASYFSAHLPITISSAFQILQAVPRHPNAVLEAPKCWRLQGWRWPSPVPRSGASHADEEELARPSTHQSSHGHREDPSPHPQWVHDKYLAVFKIYSL